MEYKLGYVAFIDILGFSNYVSDESNGEKIKSFFSFVKKLCYLYDTSPELKTEVVSFSDSMVITSDNLDSIMIVIMLAECYLKDSLGLLFRGGIVYGKYYHEDNITFGPAVIMAYKLENIASYSRIIIDKGILNEDDECELIYKDIDGFYCINPFGYVFHMGIEYGGDKLVYPEDISGTILSNIKNYRKELEESIHKWRGTLVVEKYLWRVRPFNYTCKLISEMP